jgi:hypothetical protein
VIAIPDIEALSKLPFDKTSEVTGIRAIDPSISQGMSDRNGLWWVVPFAEGESGTTYGFRLSLDECHGAVVRCLYGHAVTIASRPDQAFVAVLAMERMLGGENFRKLVHRNLSKVRGLLGDAVSITGGDPALLDAALHAADGLPDWISPASAADDQRSRKVLWKMTGDDGGGPTWARSNDSRLAPQDPEACLRLLEGNHGIDGTHSLGGFMPDSEAARVLLVDAARNVQNKRLSASPPWKAVIDAIATNGEPTPDDFILAVGLEPSSRSWDALAMASFWFFAIGNEVPEEQIAMAQRIARELGANHILAAREWP